MAEESPPRPHYRRPLLIGLGVLALILILMAGGLLWLTRTESGFAALGSLAHRLTAGRLTLVPAGGTLAGPLQLKEAVWQTPDQTVRIKDIHIDWNPVALIDRRLEIGHLTAAAVRIEPGPEKKPPTRPDSLRLPAAVHVGEFRLGRLERGETLLAEDISGRFESDGLRHRLSDFQARAGRVDIKANAQLAGIAPFPLDIQAGAATALEGHAFSLDLHATGNLDAVQLSGRAGGALQGTLSGVATPFADQPFQHLQVHLKGIDPAVWQEGSPTAKLDLDADLLPRQVKDEWQVGGPFTVINRTPGRLDARRLPVEKLSGRVDWRGDTAAFSGLAANLTGGGGLAGRGRLAGKELSLDLNASRIDASLLHPRLKPTRLSGPLSVKAGAEEQSLEADLTDPQFKLAARATRRGETVDIPSLKLTAGQARLEARGRLDLNRSYRFEARGELADFDPSRFAQAPSARLNATFEARGTLQPKPAVALTFDLGNSRFRGQPLGGRGTVDLAWPAVRKADVVLTGGPNRLEARGAFGRPGDRLDLTIDAPALGPYGIEGGIRGQLRLAGTPAAPALGGELRSERLGLPGGGRLLGLDLKGEGSSRPGDPLRLDLRVAAVDLPDRPSAAREIAIRIQGSRSRHDLEAAALLPGQRRLTLAAAGGLADKSGSPLWSGRLDQLALASPWPDQSLRLLAPAPLRVGKDQWSLGPAELAGSEWQARLLANAAGGRLRAEAAGSGPRLGKIDAALEARLEGAWKLAQSAPWQGRLDLSAADIAWIGPLLGEDWRTAGRLQGELRLAGTPARPLMTGQLRGDRLGLGILGQGLQLENGTLAADLTGDRLQVTALAFDSRLRPLPAALRARGDLARLTATPGRLEVKGEIELSGSGRAVSEDRGNLDIRLDRVGVLQQPDQWVAVSGNGRLRWRGSILGVEGKLQADAGYWELSRLGTPKLSDDVVIRKPRQAGERDRPATRPRLDLDVAIDLGPAFHFAGNGLESRLAGNVRLRAAGQDLPRATGTIQTVGGRFDAYGQKLTVERGIINFQGFLDNPALNVRAVRKGLPVEPGVEVTGPVKRPVVRLVSEPELPEAEKLSWLVLGRGSEQLGGNDASTLLNAASALLGREPSGGGVMQQLQRRLGFEELGLRQGQVGDPGGRQATSRIVGGGFTGGTPASAGGQIVTVSRRLSSNVLLSYEQALGRTENIVKLTVNLSRRLSVVGRAGSDNAIDLFYTFTFGK
jgi:translocation and assembly module TamB